MRLRGARTCGILHRRARSRCQRCCHSGGALLHRCRRVVSTPRKVGRRRRQGSGAVRQQHGGSTRPGGAHRIRGSKCRPSRPQRARIIRYRTARHARHLTQPRHLPHYQFSGGRIIATATAFTVAACSSLRVGGVIKWIGSSGGGGPGTTWRWRAAGGRRHYRAHGGCYPGGGGSCGSHHGRQVVMCQVAHGGAAGGVRGVSIGARQVAIRVSSLAAQGGAVTLDDGRGAWRRGHLVRAQRGTKRNVVCRVQLSVIQRQAG